MTSLGYAYCINEETCVYRFQVPNSATSKWKSDKNTYVRTANRFIEMYEDFYSLFQEKYYIFKQRSLEWEFNKALVCKDYKTLRKNEYKKLYKAKGKKAYIKYLLFATFPRICTFIRGL